MAGFRREALTEALLEARIVQAWVMRCTIHMVSAGDYAPFTEAVRAGRHTFLVDGQVAGTWRVVDGAVRPEPFEELSAAAGHAVAAAAERLGEFYAR